MKTKHLFVCSDFDECFDIELHALPLTESDNHPQDVDNNPLHHDNLSPVPIIHIISQQLLVACGKCPSRRSQ